MQSHFFEILTMILQVIILVVLLVTFFLSKRVNELRGISIDNLTQWNVRLEARITDLEKRIGRWL